MMVCACGVIDESPEEWAPHVASERVRSSEVLVVLPDPSPELDAQGVRRQHGLD